MKLPRWLRPKSTMDILHYLIVGGVLILSWIPLMDLFGSNVTLTSLVWLALFYVTDKFTHNITHSNV